MEVAARDAFLDEYDRPTYQIPVPAPLAELAYQFTLVNPDGSFTTSKRFSARRSCLPSVELSNPKAIESLEGTERMTALIEQAKSLENDLIGYQRVMELLESIDKAVAK
ncbi:MAG: hypothetical protein DCC75_02505 [Proteobacteria bacterium]|nr:MAG: hypothetical protein DCC75_02505 [Pseudomonadota bacterium]